MTRAISNRAPVVVIKGYRVFATLRGKQSMQAISRIFHSQQAAYDFQQLAAREHPDAEVRPVMGVE